MAQDQDATDEQLYADLPSPLYLSPSELIETYHPNVLAPLVRCSKLPFRHLTSLYETHITHTPMILAEEFSRAQIARTSDFSTSSNERGVFWMTPNNGKGERKGSILPTLAIQRTPGLRKSRGKRITLLDLPIVFPRRLLLPTPKRSSFEVA